MTLAVIVCGGYAMFRLGRREGRTLGGLAWRAAQAAGVALLLSVLVYQKPQSFYTNFVIVPSLFLFLAGLLCVVATLALAVAASIKGDSVRRAWQASGAALVALVAATLVILWRAS